MATTQRAQRFRPRQAGQPSFVRRRRLNISGSTSRLPPIPRDWHRFTPRVSSTAAIGVLAGRPAATRFYRKERVPSQQVSASPAPLSGRETVTDIALAFHRTRQNQHGTINTQAGRTCSSHQLGSSARSSARVGMRVQHRNHRQAGPYSGFLRVTYRIRWAEKIYWCTGRHAITNAPPPARQACRGFFNSELVPIPRSNNVRLRFSCVFHHIPPPPPNPFIRRCV